jgi:hypothetical protein
VSAVFGHPQLMQTLALMTAQSAEIITQFM